MNPDDSSQRKHRVLLIILLLLLIFGAIAWYFWPRPDRGAPSEELGQGFSPFDRTPVQTQTEELLSGAPYRPVTTAPATPNATPVAPETPVVIYTEPEQETFYEQRRDTFVIPSTQQSQTVVDQPVYEYTADPIYITPTGYYASTYTQQQQTPEDPYKPVRKDTLLKIDQQLFGFVTGLGTLRLFGDSGEELFDKLFYGLGGPLGVGPGGSGPGFGGGFGGGGGGGQTSPFGGEVTNITYCTCNASTLLDINDVNQGSLSLLYQAGTSELYAYYNVFGTGQNVLGTYTQGGGSCLVYVGEGCDTEGNPNGTIKTIGTSE